MPHDICSTTGVKAAGALARTGAGADSAPAGSCSSCAICVRTNVCHVWMSAAKSVVPRSSAVSFRIKPSVMALPIVRKLRRKLVAWQFRPGDCHVHFFCYFCFKNCIVSSQKKKGETHSSATFLLTWSSMWKRKPSSQAKQNSAWHACACILARNGAKK